MQRSQYLLKRLRRQVKSLIFPPLCFHCQTRIEDSRHLLCRSCFDLLTLIDLKSRCTICFVKIDLRNKRCHSCPPQVLKLAAACEHQGPIVSLLGQLKYHKRFALARGLASLLTMQWAALKWPLPDLIVPIPQTTCHRLLYGYNASRLLAQELGKQLNIPTASLLKRKGVIRSQTHLSHAERQDLPLETFQWKTKRSLVDQTILLIDDAIVTGATLRKAAERLKERTPARIYGLTLTCRQ